MTSTLRRSLIGVAALIISVACTDCVGRSPIGGSQPSSGVSGDLVYIGGPAASATTSPTPSPKRVTAFTLDGAIAAGAYFSEGKSFTLYLEPGTYRLVSKSGGVRCPAVTVTVEANRFETIKIRCSVK